MLPKVAHVPPSGQTDSREIKRALCHSLTTIEESNDPRAVFHLTIPYLTIGVPEVTDQRLTNETFLLQGQYLAVLEERKVVSCGHICHGKWTAGHQRKRDDRLFFGIVCITSDANEVAVEPHFPVS